MFLRNAWYVAAWSGDLLRNSTKRMRIMNNWIALFRLEDGSLSAISDRCPHRFASLSQGKVVGDTLECPYHGLRFDGSGRCVHNPHGDGALPPERNLTNYALAERHGAIWIWMGVRDAADEAQIPDFSQFDSPEFSVSRDYLHVNAPVELVTDNLLDLSHVAFLHPFLASSASTGRTRTAVAQQGTTVRSYFWIDDEPVTPLFQLVWDDEEQVGQLRSHMRWTPPSTLLLDVGMTAPGRREEDSPALPSAHLLTPESETSTHYFWMIGRNRRHEDEALGKQFHDGIAYAFTKEDEPMISRSHENMAGEEFWSLRPLILPGDAAAVRARRVFAKLLREEGAPQALPERATV